MQRVLNPKLLDSGTMKEVFELRLVIEIGIGDILFLKKTPENLDQLEEMITKEKATKNKIEKIKYDVKFHTMLYKISGNKNNSSFPG